MKTFEKWARIYFSIEPSENFKETIGMQEITEDELEEAWDACAKECEQRLKEAEEVIAFYADKEKWRFSMDSKSEIEAKDFENLGNSVWSGGKRAREYQSKYKLSGDK